MSPKKKSSLGSILLNSLVMQRQTRDKLKLRSKDCYDLKTSGPEMKNGGNKNLKNDHKDFKDKELDLNK